MVWNVRKRDVDFFVDDLWKDLRGFSTSQAGELGKNCFSESGASHEAMVLNVLAERMGDNLVPHVLRVEGPMLYMERVQGIRLFDLIRHLRAAELDMPEPARAARKAVMASAGQQLARLQEVLFDLGNEGALGPLTPYPLELKIRRLIELFISVLGLRVATDEWVTELAALSRDWESVDCVVPFRDATTKNVIARLDLPPEPTGDLEGWQREHVYNALAQKPATFWGDLILTDVDFSSIVNATSPEDDPISLYFHEWTADTITLSADALILSPKLGRPNPRRAALTLLVRYLRFGGRKLAYRLINTQGFSVRFAYDDPLYYFRNARAHCDRLDPSLSIEAANLFDIVDAIGSSFSTASAADLQVTRIDHVRRFGHVADYWQQSPQEGDE